MNHTARTITVAAAAAAVTAACAGAAVAAPTANGAALAAVKAKAAAAISARQSSLNATIPAVSGNPYLTPGDKATALTTLNNDLSGLTALAPQIAADSTLATASTGYLSIFGSYRVYALALPQTRYAAATDDVTTAVLPHLTDAQTRLQDLLAGPDASKDTQAVQAAMTQLGSEISAINTATGGLSGSLLALTPAQYDANHAILSGPRATLTTVRGEIKTARGDIATVVSALQ